MSEVVKDTQPAVVDVTSFDYSKQNPGSQKGKKSTKEVKIPATTEEILESEAQKVAAEAGEEQPTKAQVEAEETKKAAAAKAQAEKEAKAAAEAERMSKMKYGYISCTLNEEARTKWTRFEIIQQVGIQLRGSLRMRMNAGKNDLTWQQIEDIAHQWQEEAVDACSREAILELAATWVNLKK